MVQNVFGKMMMQRVLYAVDQTEVVDKVPTSQEYNQTVDCTTTHNKKIRKLYHLKDVALKDLILLMNHKCMTGKNTFHPIKYCKTDEYPKTTVTWLGYI